ncbi:MAG TPA: DUF4349 domain-containing protein [Thermoleophilaceae bacterium]|nr:DUF4349 domain-containing protein [Thermoleophilaceae bacterium]
MNEETTLILIDTALASGSASALDPEERRLQELVLTVRDDAPVPDPGFELRMNARVAAGFPPRRRGRIHALLTTRPQMAALGAAASILIALVVAVSLLNSGGSTTSTSSAPSSAGPVTGAGSSSDSAGSSTLQSAPGGGSAAESAPAAKSAPSVGAGVPSPVPPAPGGFVGGSDRKVERSAALVLAPSKDKLNEVGDQVIAVTDRYRGIVQSSSVTSAGDASSGSFDLRIPVRNLQPALRDLSALADVKSRTENADDVTASFVNARTRLEELQAERRGLLRRLEKAPTDQAAAAIRARIRIVNGQIDAQTQSLAEMRRRTSYAAVQVNLEPTEGSSGGGITGGANDLRDSLVDSVNIALRVLGVALPIGLVLALLWLIGGRFNRRRREAVLD